MPYNRKVHKGNEIMPATYAHRKFGREIAALSGEQFPEIAAHEKAFALGLHGPDPLFYYKPLKKNDVKKKGDLLHEERAADFFTAARPVYLARGSRAADRAYLLGFACHFCLDSVCHGEVARQMELTGMTHVGVEAAFERILLKEDGHDPVKARLATHISAEKDAVSALATYCGVTEREAKKAAKAMRFYSDLLRAPGAFRRGMLRLGLRIAGKYDSIAPMMIPAADTAAADASNAALRPLYDRAVGKAKKLLPNLREFLERGTALDEAFMSNFESEKQI